MKKGQGREGRESRKLRNVAFERKGVAHFTEKRNEREGTPLFQTCKERGTKAEGRGGKAAKNS